MGVKEFIDCTNIIIISTILIPILIKLEEFLQTELSPFLETEMLRVAVFVCS